MEFYPDTRNKISQWHYIGTILFHLLRLLHDDSRSRIQRQVATDQHRYMQATGAAQRCVAAATNYVTEHVRLSAKQLYQSQAYVSVVSNTACGILSVMQSFDVRVFVLLFCVLP